jgi:hypothetical protein
MKSCLMTAGFFYVAEKTDEEKFLSKKCRIIAKSSVFGLANCALV